MSLRAAAHALGLLLAGCNRSRILHSPRVLSSAMYVDVPSRFSH